MHELKEVFEPGTAPRAEHREALRATLIGTRTRARSRRFLLAAALPAAAVAIATVVACSSPSTYEEEAGASISYRLVSKASLPGPEVVEPLVAGENVTLASVMMNRAEGSESNITFSLVGDAASIARVQEKLRALEGIDSSSEKKAPLRTEVHGTRAGRVLGVHVPKIDAHAREEARTRIANELRARGFTDVHVEVEDGDGPRIRVRVERPRKDGEPSPPLPRLDELIGAPPR
jgi:hypothetical protein